MFGFYTPRQVEQLLNDLTEMLTNKELERVKELESRLFSIRRGSVAGYKLAVAKEMERIWGYGSSHLGRLN